MNTIAFDPGYGNTKVIVDGRAAVLQSAIVRPKDIGLAAMGFKSHPAMRQIPITVQGERYVAGEGAWLVGEPLGSMDYSTLSLEPRRCLFYAALTSILEPGEYQADMVVGLPVPLLAMSEEAQAVISAFRFNYRTTHRWETRAGQYSLTINRVQPLAQPVGAYTDWLLDDQLRQRKGAAAAEVAIIDLGMNTLDLFVVKGGRIVERFVGGGTVGVRRLLYRLNGHGQDLVELDHELRMGALKPTGSQLDAWLDEVLGLIERTWPNLKRFQAVIPAGGGAVVLGDLLRLALLRKGAAVAWPDDPILTNARGLWKWLASTSNRK